MTSPKLIASPARLAELALANGWSPDEVASTLVSIVGPIEPSVEVMDVRPAPAAGRGKANESSRILREEFGRVAARKR